MNATKRSIFSFLAVIVTVSILFASFRKTEKKKSGKVKGFAVVELFTSEGCSSCPPADNAVIELAKDYPEHVYILGYHVDYWDHIGWKDAYSQALFSQRQKSYAGKLHIISIYTPQIIINGKTELVGSKKSSLQSAVQEGLDGFKPVPVKLTIEQATGDSVKVKYEAENSHKEFLQIALVQLKAETSVKKGENEGRLLHHINIVRDLETIGGNRNLSGTISFRIPLHQSAKDFTIIAFIQDKESWKITGAESVSL